jgi:hypothetical protein
MRFMSYRTGHFYIYQGLAAMCAADDAADADRLANGGGGHMSEIVPFPAVRRVGFIRNMAKVYGSGSRDDDRDVFCKQRRGR